MRKVKTTPLAIRMSQTSDRRKYRSGRFIGPRPSRKVHLVFSRPKSLELDQSQIGPSATALALGAVYFDSYLTLGSPLGLGFIDQRAWASGRTDREADP